MTVVLRRNQALELNAVEYHGSVTLAELVALAQHQAETCQHLKSDTLNVVMPGANFRSIELAELDALFENYRRLYGALVFQLLRRSAWICKSDEALPHVRHWIEGRDMRDGISSDVRRFDDITEAGDWLVLSASETAAVARGEGFDEIARFTIPAETPQTATVSA